MCQEPSFGWGGFSLYHLQEPCQCLGSAAAGAVAPQEQQLLSLSCWCLTPSVLTARMDRPGASSHSHTSAPLAPAGDDAGWGQEQPARDGVVAARRATVRCLSEGMLAETVESSELKGKTRGTPNPLRSSRLDNKFCVVFLMGWLVLPPRAMICCQLFRIVVLWRKPRQKSLCSWYSRLQHLFIKYFVSQLSQQTQHATFSSGYEPRSTRLKSKRERMTAHSCS